MPEHRGEARHDERAHARIAQDPLPQCLLLGRNGEIRGSRVIGEKRGLMIMRRSLPAGKTVRSARSRAEQVRPDG